MANLCPKFVFSDTENASYVFRVHHLGLEKTRSAVVCWSPSSSTILNQKIDSPIFVQSVGGI